MTKTTTKDASVTIERMDGAPEPDEGTRDRLAGLLPADALDDALKGLSSDEITGTGGLLSQLAGRVIDAALAGELSDHLGYPPGQAPPGGSGNHRNGSTPKTVQSDLGPVSVNTPRDRNGSFDPKLVAKRQTRLAGLDARSSISTPAACRSATSRRTWRRSTARRASAGTRSAGSPTRCSRTSRSGATGRWTASTRSSTWTPWW